VGAILVCCICVALIALVVIWRRRRAAASENKGTNMSVINYDELLSARDEPASLRTSEYASTNVLAASSTVEYQRVGQPGQGGDGKGVNYAGFAGMGTSSITYGRAMPDTQSVVYEQLPSD